MPTLGYITPPYRVLFYFYLFLYLSRGIQFSRASLNEALTKHKNKDIETLKLNNFIDTLLQYVTQPITTIGTTWFPHYTTFTFVL